MVQTLQAQDNGMRSYVVLRAIFIAGERVEPGAAVSLSRIVGAELAAANKVAPDGSPAAEAAREAARAAAKAAKAAKKPPKPADLGDAAAQAAPDAATAVGGTTTESNSEESS